MTREIDRLREHLSEIMNLQHAGQVLSWDESTYMPRAGADARGAAMATVSRIAHEMFIADETGQLLESAAAALNGNGPDSDEARLVKVAQRDYERDRKIPSDLIAEIERHA